MRNHIKNKFFAIILSLTLFCSTGVTAFAISGEESPETVYALLDTKGSVKEFIVQNSGGEQKTTEGELPFNVKISYRFDDKEVTPEEILGKKGNVKISVDINPNSKSKPYYKEKLALQMQFPIKTEDGKATNIVADGLSGVNVGYTKTLSGIVMPSTSASYEISYETEKFEQQAVNFICMPFDLTGMVDLDISSIEKQVGELQTAISQYVEGVAVLSKGLSDANAGIKQISSGNEALLKGYAQTAAGEAALLQAMLSAIPIEQQKLFEPQIQAVQAGQKQISDSINKYCGGVSQAGAGLNVMTAAAAELAENGKLLDESISSALAPLAALPANEAADFAPESFVSEDKVSEIQFVMKTDALNVTVEKQDVTPANKPKATFWSRLLALFGL